MVKILLRINENDLKKLFLKLNVNKAAGPDIVTHWILKYCAYQPSLIYTKLFTVCVTDHIPSLWKTSTIIPVRKHNKPSVLHDYRPVALAFKCLERIILKNITSIG